MKRYLTIIIVLFIFVIRVNAEDYKTGDLVSYKNIKFYVIEDKGDYLTLLKAIPLTADEINGYGEDGGKYREEFFGTGFLRYCNPDQPGNPYMFEESNAKAALDSWSKQLDDKDLVADEVTYNEYENNDSHIVTNSYKVRLLTLKELTQKFGYIKNDENDIYYPSLKTPNFVLNYRYFLMDYDDNSYNNFCYRFYVDIDNFVSAYEESSLRPVINLSKNSNIIKLKPAVKSIVDSEFKIGDIVEYNGVEYYVLKNSDKNDKTVTMIKRIPLSFEDVNKYKTNNMEVRSYQDYDEITDLIYNAGFVNYYYRENGCSNYDDYEQCQNDYESSDIKPVVDAWVKDNINKSDIVEDELGYKGRLITIDELENDLGYIGQSHTVNSLGVYYKMSEKTPFALDGCWTMSPVLDSQKNVYRVGTKNGINSGEISSIGVYDKFAIYPVVTIKKNIEDNIMKDNNKVNVPNTLLKNPIFIVVIGIILIVVATVTVSLVIKNKNKFHKEVD